LRQELSLKREDFILLSVGELIERKNHLVVIEALKQIGNPNIHYVIAGDGVLFDFLSEKVRKLELEERVHLLGYRTDISKLCSCADVFALPSLQEGLSVALMEAMACARPIIASKIRGNVDLIDHKVGGILVEATDINGFANAIVYCYENQEVLVKYAQHNVCKVREYDLSKVTTQLSFIYNECLED
jgi:glycosyltransferase involved in cell wall biosynthesis